LPLLKKVLQIHAAPIKTGSWERSLRDFPDPVTGTETDLDTKTETDKGKEKNKGTDKEKDTDRDNFQ
jgi:hypothetical protein